MKLSEKLVTGRIFQIGHNSEISYKISPKLSDSYFPVYPSNIPKPIMIWGPYVCSVFNNF